MKKRVLLIIAGLFLLTSFPVTGASAKVTQPPSQKEEIIYHIFQRSFFDSDGDGHGDLNGIRQKLDYLQQLGVTAVLLTPLYESVYYHNYFATDFYKIDPRYGTMQDYLRLIKELHRRGMKFYMDMETQYVASDHIWFRDSYKNPQSKYSDYIIYTDKTNAKPLQIVAGISDFKGYDGVTRKLVMVNLDNKEVQAYNLQLFKFWMDPNHDGKFDDGVDGFRLDHMMDNLDNLNRLPHLFTTFWNPLLGKLRKINPKIKIVAEQANWASFGLDYLKDIKIDRVFAFRLAFAIRNFNKAELVKVADSTLIQAPKGKQQVVFIENHDMPRFSDAVKGDPGKLRVGCALNLLIGGIPSIYYGQELGMQGSRQNFGITDANDIPDRQAFEWYKSDTGRGMAYWYKNGPWWQHNNNDVPNDGISLQEEQNNTQSLWIFYRMMIRLRKNNPVLISGAYKNLINNNDHVFSFLRYDGDKKVLVAVDLSGDKQDVVIDVQDIKNSRSLYGVKSVISQNNLAVSLPAYGIAVWAVN
ncbi:alpha-amylase family glycosyl hydrolase [Mucilaginibacter sp. X5P1]|uniref:alpha-amylase family glycosyl hydrolase n=1 Tax=Mucilaginibacter sp. X5P1 TaxID=2723088 RepID=UPI00162084B9|nr:alpha-amylase family glycosyl hydrolase [Mucilaginibacter sp. X5P1]MBB6139466.1 glycosidase [Mucilaginibacter sp. X5P1]